MDLWGVHRPQVKKTWLYERLNAAIQIHHKAFADDTVLLMANSKLKYLLHYVNEQLSAIATWQCKNKLCMNHTKMWCMISMIFQNKKEIQDSQIKSNLSSVQDFKAGRLL